MGRTRRAAAKKALVRIHDISVEALAVMKALRKSKNGSRRWHEELNRNATRKQKHIEVIQISSSSESEEEEVKLVRRKKARSSTPNENQKPSAVILRPGPVTRSDCTLTKPSARALVGKSPRSSSQTKPPGSGTVTHLPGGGSVAKSPAPASVTNIQGSELMARRSGSASVKKKPRHASNTKSLRSSHQIDESQGPDSLRKRMDLPSVASPTGLKTERCQKAFLNEQKGPVSSSCNSVRPITTCTPDQASPLDNFPPPNNTITSPLVEPELRADAFESDSFNSVEPAYYDTEIEDAAFQEIPESEALFASNETEIGDEQKLEILDTALDLENMQRFQCYLHSGINFKTVRSIMQIISKNPVEDVCVWAMCDLVKSHVEDIMDTALDYEETCGSYGPLSPEAILAGYLKLKIEQSEL